MVSGTQPSRISSRKAFLEKVEQCLLAHVSLLRLSARSCGSRCGVCWPGRLSFLCVLLIWICFLFANRLLRDSRKALWTAAVVAFDPYLVRFQSGTFRIGCHLPLRPVRSLILPRMAGKAPLSPGPFGLCLVMTYLTRPDTLFFTPFALFSPRKEAPSRFCDAPCAFPVVGVAYILYLHMQTGTYMVSNRVTLSPFPGLTSFFRRSLLSPTISSWPSSPYFFFLPYVAFHGPTGLTGALCCSWSSFTF